jgi:hypothetical protein
MVNQISGISGQDICPEGVRPGGRVEGSRVPRLLGSTDTIATSAPWCNNANYPGNISAPPGV